MANEHNISHLTFNAIGLKFCAAILDLSTAGLGFNIRFTRDVDFGREAVVLKSGSIKDLVKEGVDLQVTVLCE